MIESFPRNEIGNENMSLNPPKNQSETSIESLSMPSSTNTSVSSTSIEEFSIISLPELSVKPFYDTSHLRPPPRYFPITPKINIRITSNVGPITRFSGTCNVKIEKKYEN